ncbi:uncharacterized protein LOC105445603 [Strongylocentrotus purpuratus]|uniref:Uncharacterized protein n=1 Tax=Strongylocentrotus purpuratus TaxID=7668 RepID=A0A7M7LWH3_STRPU|nr:uncharacterized protein LOC105445603 [Strongylocentrotus purpuratus]
MPRNNHWYSHLKANDLEKKKEVSKYMKMYRLIKADIRHLISELAPNTAQPGKSKACYRALHRIFHEKSTIRSKEAARLMLALGDPDLLRALQRRYSKPDCSGYIDVQRRYKHSDTKKIHGVPVGRIEMSGDVIHTVFSETGVTQDASHDSKGDKSVMERKELINSEQRKAIINNTSCGDQPFPSRSNLGGNISLQEYSFSVSEDRKTCLATSSKPTNGTEGANIGVIDVAGSIKYGVQVTSSSVSAGCPPFKKTSMVLTEEVVADKKQSVCLRKDLVGMSAPSNIPARTDSVSNYLEKAGTVQPLGYLSSLCASPVPQDSLDQATLMWNHKQYPRPSSGPAILLSDNSPDQKKRVLHATSLHRRPGAISLPDGRISIPASIPKMPSSTLINRVKSSQEVSLMSNISQTRKNIVMTSMGMMDPMNSSTRYELPQGIFEDLHVVKQHRRSCFADGNSLVEVRPRSMPTAPTLIATHTPDGKFNVPIDIESNRRAILVINAMNNVRPTYLSRPT